MHLAAKKKAKDILMLDIRKLSTLSDYFIVCSAPSNIHVRTIAEFIKSELKKEKVYPLHTEGMAPAQWVLIDYGGVVVHVFYERTRQFYGLERLWSDAKKVELDTE